ncbi:MAG: hypothetical protein NVSMB28_21270 [Collimonas sp.]
MTSIVRYQIFILVICMMVVFLSLEGLFDKVFLAILLNSLTITTGVAVVATYAVPAIRGVWKDPTDRVTQLILGIALMFTSLILNRIGVMFIPHYSGSPLFSAIAFLIFISGILHLSPQFTAEGRITNKMMAIITAIVVSGATVAALVYTYSPNPF